MQKIPILQPLDKKKFLIPEVQIIYTQNVQNKLNDIIGFIGFNFKTRLKTKHTMLMNNIICRFPFIPHWFQNKIHKNIQCS
jgi:hypothetical protein